MSVNGKLLGGGLLALLGVGVLVYMFIGSSGPGETQLDENLCPVDPDHLGERHILLVDLTKPMDGAAADFPGSLVDTVAKSMDLHDDLDVYTVGVQTGLRQLQRVCKPYANDDLARVAKDHIGERDCGNLPAQISTDLRHKAEAFCAIRARLRTHINNAAKRITPLPSPALLVEALEELTLGLPYVERSGPAGQLRRQTFLVASDMLQHSSWYSHLDVDWTEWSFAGFLERREAIADQMGPHPAWTQNVGVTIFYTPREGITESRRSRRAHQRFWSSYFMGLPKFQDQDVLPAFASTPMMGRMSDLEQAEAERLRLEQTQDEALRLITVVQQEREALAADRRLLERLRREDEARRAAEAKDSADAAETESVAARDDPPAPKDQAPELESDAEAPPAAQPSADTAVAAADSPAVAQEPVMPPCGLKLNDQHLTTLQNSYPISTGGRAVNFGDAVVVMAYTIDEDGDTEDGSVVVIQDSSQFSEPKHAAVFERHVQRIVAGWTFSFKPPAGGGECRKRQRIKSRLVFQA